MKIVRIKGVKEDASVIRESLEGVSSSYPIFIIDADKVLYKFIEELDMNESLLFRLKISKEIELANTKVMLKEKITEDIVLDNITSLSNLLENIDENMTKNCKLIVDTEDNNLISEIVQAFIYLNIDLEVMMEKEKNDRKIFHAFRSQFDRIRTAVVNAKKTLFKLNTFDGFFNEKEALINTIFEIENDLQKARERDLNISVMATKKAGKSVVVNSFLNEQYAPTSLELPTPNTCIYKRSKDGYIRLVYGKANMLFRNGQDMYKYIYNEFKKAQNDIERGYTIDDMEIYYTNPASDFTAFTLVDTPGSNYALAKDNISGENKHKKIAYEWIQKSDVSLFLINYSNYLSIDEEEFFKEIKSEFEKHDKFYSLVVVVNKLDEMYLSECENKSAVRFLDYVRCKLSDLGYKDFIVMGTSARTYFDTIKVCKIDSEVMAASGEKIPIDQLKGSRLRERLKTLKEIYIGKNEMSALSFVDDELDKLQYFYGLKDYDLNTLKKKSGMPDLVNYTKYIAAQKAYIEVFGLLIRQIDEKFAKLKNISITNNLMNSKENKIIEVEEIESMLNNIINWFDHVQLEMESKLSFEEFKANLLIDIDSSLEKTISYISHICENRIERFFMRIMLKDSEQLRRIKNRTMDIDLSISNKVLNEELDTLVEGFLKTLNMELEKKVNYIKETEDKMKNLIQTFSDIIRKEYDLKDFNIEMPKVEQIYKKLLAVKLPEAYVIDNRIKEKVIDSIEIRGNIISKLASHFMRDKYGYYAVNGEQLESIKDEYITSIKNNINILYRASYDLLKTNLITYLDNFKVQIEEYFRRNIHIYHGIIDDILKSLTDSKLDIENQLDYLEIKLKFFAEVDKISKGFIDEWSMIRDSAV